MTAPSILAAKAEALAARADLDATLAELRDRASPRRVARTALADLRDRGEALADRSADFARRKPAAVVGVVALAALLLARKPAARAIRRLFSNDDATPSDGSPLKPVEEEILP